MAEREGLLQKALEKAASFCAYQERSIQEVINRLEQYALSSAELEGILDYLQNENFLNEERFAENFARSKFQLKGWGRLKIKHGLIKKGVSNQRIERALTTISTDEYAEVLEKLLLSKCKEISSKKDAWQAKQQLYRFASSRGFESELVLEKLESLTNKAS